ncbi:MAG: Uncharacterised protein [Polaribacter sp. SA4-10]|nr:MAG: Uncharacterised protein [Polaribacter sp. SA4-10]
MTEWFSGLSPFQQTYWVLTGIASLFFLVVLMATFIGADGDDIGDVDAEIEVDTGVGFQFLPLKTWLLFSPFLVGVELQVWMLGIPKRPLF